MISGGDGVWYFYARFFLEGNHLYSEMKLVQQPFFILYNALGIKLFGDTFVAQKIIFIPLILANLYVLLKLVSLTKLDVFFQSLLYLAVFFTGIHFEAYRFDDYHLMTNTLILYQMFFLIKYLENAESKSFIKVLGLGLVSTLEIFTRINDGLVFFVLVLFVITTVKSSYSKRNVLIFLFITLVVVISIFTTINELPSSWIKSTIFDAMSNKGGERVFQSFYFLIANSFFYILNIAYQITNIQLIFALIFILLIIYCNSIEKKFINLVGLLFVFVEVLFYLYGKSTDPISDFTALSIIFLSGYFLFLCGSNLKEIFKNGITYLKTRNLIILSMPLIAFFSGSMSSGGYHYGLYFPASIVLLALSYLGFFKLQNYKVSILFLLLLASYGLAFRFNNPYSWHSYSSANPYFSKRDFVHLDKLGLVYIDEKLKDFITPVCNYSRVENSTLLSIPFPFANYYCGIPVWHNYVQTFFDTTSKGSINNLIQELNKNPPKMIFYQQQLDNLRGHEIIFNAGTKLPHRDLDGFIMKKINDGNWKVLYISNYGQGNKWYLIETWKK